MIISAEQHSDPGNIKDWRECEESGLGVMLGFQVHEQSSEHVDVRVIWYMCFLIFPNDIRQTLFLAWWIGLVSLGL